jgi:hypothetical protein
MRARRIIVGLTTTLAAGAAAAAPVSRPPGAKACIDSQSIDSRQAESADTLLFSVGRTTYRNHLRTECPGLMRLNSFDSIATEQTGSQLCEGDTVRIFDPTTVRAVGIEGYPRCVLGWFEPIPTPPKPAKQRH